MNRWKHSLQFTIIILYLILVVLPISAWGVLNTRLITEEVETLLVDNIEGIIKKQLDSLDVMYTRASDVAVQLMLDNDVRKNLQGYTGTLDMEGTQKYNALKDSMENILIQNSEYMNLAFISDGVLQKMGKGKQPMITTGYFGSLEELKLSSWYIHTRYVFDVPALIQYDDVLNKKEESGSDLIFLMAYKHIGNNRKLGTLCIRISKTYTKKILSMDGNRMHAQQIVYDQMGNSIFDSIEEKKIKDVINQNQDYNSGYLYSFTCKADNEEYLILKGKSDVSKLSIAYAVPKKEIFNKISDIQKFNMLVGGTCFLFSVLVLGIIFWKILKPIVGIHKEMEKVEAGNFEIKKLDYGENEIGRLAVRFSEMIASIKEKNQQIVTGEQKKREYEIMLLQAQINPHFLYNTLDSIKWMAVAQGEETIERMTQALGQLLRKTISDNKEFVTIAEEIETVDCYIEIQKLRYYDSFDYFVNMEESCKMAYMPRLTLQPLIENALFHGIFNCGRRGQIHVDIKKEEGEVVITIVDNGRGMDIHEIVTPEKNSDKVCKIGIKNVNERIKLYYGNEFGLTYESVKGEFTRVSVRMPWQQKPYRSIE